jgi:hypothetical protein
MSQAVSVDNLYVKQFSCGLYFAFTRDEVGVGDSRGEAVDDVFRLIEEV